MMEASSSGHGEQDPGDPARVRLQAASDAGRVREVARRRVPANAAAVKPMIAPAPRITTTMPIHRSAFSYLINRGVIRLSMT